MLSLYDSFDVPGVPYVKIYRDDERTNKFYMVSEQATIARDDEGAPIFSFILYARDLDRLSREELEIEQGYLSATTQAAVTAEAEEKIRLYLKEKLENEKRKGWRFLFQPLPSIEPELGYPPLWLDGTVEFRAVPGNMATFSVGSTKPSLMGGNTASFAVQLNQDGAELFRQAIEDNVNIAGVWYNLTFAARIPAIKIRVHGNKGEFYNEVKNYIHHRWSHVTRYYYLGWPWRHTEWKELSSISTFRNEFHNLSIDINDSTLPGEAKNEMNEKLETMAMEIVNTNILATFFQQALVDVKKEIENPATMIPMNESLTGTIDVTFSRSEIVKKIANPNAFLSKVMTPEEIKAATVYADLGNAVFQELDITINANVDFAADSVYGLKVGIEYDQQDDVRSVRIRKSKTFLFKNAETVGRFRQTMAKATDGSVKDEYGYWSELSYKGTGETIRIPTSGYMRTNERQLVISYRRLGFIKVNITLGVLPDSVKAVNLDMHYPGSSLPSAHQSFELTPEKPVASFFTYTGSNSEPGPYRYKASYILANGQNMELAEQAGQSEILVLRDPFEERVTARFLAQADFSVVEKILVDTRYSDSQNDYRSDFHAEFTANGSTDSWTIGLRDPAKRSFEYDVTILYKNGSREEKKNLAGTFGSTIAVGGGGVDALEVTVIAGLIDWQVNKLAIMTLNYTDGHNNIHEEKTFTFRQENSNDDPKWRVLLRDATQRSYTYRVRIFANDSAANREIGPVTTTETVLVIQ